MLRLYCVSQGGWAVRFGRWPMKRERVDPGWAWTKKLNFWVGWKLNETVQLSGLVAFDTLRARAAA